MVETARFRVPDATDVDREIGSLDDLRIPGAHQFAAWKNQVEHGDCPDIVGVKFSGVCCDDHKKPW